MKIRYGFVSNSSSSSFAIMGVSIDENKIDKILEEHLGKDYTLVGDHKWKDNNGPGFISSDDLIFDKTGLNTYGGEMWETGTSYGEDIYKMGDNETKAQFAKRVADKLKLVGITDKPDFIYDGTYEG